MTLADQAFLARLQKQIPLLRHMGIDQLSYQSAGLLISAALAPNVNDKGTGFGGSLATLATIGGWSLVTRLLEDQQLDCEVMIRDSQLTFLAPVTAAFSAWAALPAPEAVAGFLQRLRQHGQARLALQVRVQQQGEDKLTMQGNYVARLR